MAPKRIHGPLITKSLCFNNSVVLVEGSVGVDITL